MFAAGSSEQVEFTNRAVVRLGNAGPVDLKLDGKAIGPLGKAGQIRAVELTPGASRFLAEGETGGCSSTQ